MKRKDYLNLIRFFKECVKKLRKQDKVEINFGRDIKFLKKALEKMSVSEVEQLIVYFVKNEKKLQPKINVMLSKNVLKIILEIKRKRESEFWKVVNNALNEMRKGSWREFGLTDVKNEIKEKFKNV